MTFKPCGEFDKLMHKHEILSPSHYNSGYLLYLRDLSAQDCNLLFS